MKILLNFGNEETQSFEIARVKQVVSISDEILRGQAFFFFFKE